MALAARLLALLALLMMPLAMSLAPVHAQPVAEHVSVERCAERSGTHHAPAPKSIDCVTMCAALPASAKPLENPAVALAPRRIAVVEAIAGVIPEVTTPPPKSA